MKSLFILSVLALGANICLAQTESASATKDSAAAETPKKKNTLTLAAVYANNANYYGQKSAEETPYAAVAASYRLKSGFYFTGQTYKLLNENASGVSAASVGVGVNFMLSKALSADLSYSHSFYPAGSPLLQAANIDNASVSLAHTGWLTTTVTGDYAFGKTNDAFVTAGISKTISLFSISDKDVVSIAPSADVVGGTQRFFNTYITEKQERDSLFGLPVPLGGTRTYSDTSTASATAFNALSYNFKLPLSYSRAHYTVEAAYQVSVLSKQSKAEPGKLNSFFTMSFYYQF